MSITPTTEAFKKVVTERHSTRAFLPTPVPKDIIRSVLEDASKTASNCNTQPWSIHLLSGEKLASFKKEVKEWYCNGGLMSTGDFSFNQDLFTDRLHKNRMDQAHAMFSVLDIPRDAAKADDIISLNIECYGAPHLVILCFPEMGDNVRIAADMGQYAQTLMLSLQAHGLGSVPQTAIGICADKIKEFLQLPINMKVLFGISFGYEDPEAKANTVRVPRDPIESTVTFYE